MPGLYNEGMTTTLKRIAPGYYRSEDGRIEINHIVEPDQGNGYGRTDHWIVVEDGRPGDPFWTLADAKASLS